MWEEETNTISRVCTMYSSDYKHMRRCCWGFKADRRELSPPVCQLWETRQVALERLTGRSHPRACSRYLHLQHLRCQRP